ncbi:MAG: hypothetical protein Q3X95_03735 [Duodenibacillus sp.]|nr:hypothetical protein [Duodenibacillus sp.]
MFIFFILLGRHPPCEACEKLPKKHRQSGGAALQQIWIGLVYRNCAAHPKQNGRTGACRWPESSRLSSFPETNQFPRRRKCTDGIRAFLFGLLQTSSRIKHKTLDGTALKSTGVFVQTAPLFVFVFDAKTILLQKIPARQCRTPKSPGKLLC